MCVLTALLGGSCATGAPRPPQFVQRLPRGADPGPKDAGHDAVKPPPCPHKEILDSYIEKVRQLSETARPRSAPQPTLEGQDPELLAARLLLTASPGPESQRRVAAAYMRLGVLDAAFDHFKAALRLEPQDAASFDGLARIWRDWGLPNVALGDAHRAIYYAPASATVYNTLGTILQKLGQHAAAASAFEAAIRRDPRAAYALNNLCYVRFLQSRGVEAIDACNRALDLEPELAAAHNNLALAYWAEGDRMSATKAFASSGQAGAARYNTGIALLGSRRFKEAAEAFADADGVNPPVKQARQRALQARILAAGVSDGSE